MELAELLATADVVSLHVPLTAATRGMIGARQLAALCPGAVLVNSARGALVDQDALVEGLRQGRPAAALDVFDPEPLPADSPLRSLPNVYLSPHVAAGTQQARQRVRRTARREPAPGAGRTAAVARGQRRGLSVR